MTKSNPASGVLGSVELPLPALLLRLRFSRKSSSMSIRLIWLTVKLSSSEKKNKRIRNFFLSIYTFLDDIISRLTVTCGDNKTKDNSQCNAKTLQTVDLAEEKFHSEKSFYIFFLQKISGATVTQIVISNTRVFFILKSTENTKSNITMYLEDFWKCLNIMYHYLRNYL